MDRDGLQSRFLESLNLFCFFHLGSDVESEVSQESDGLRISLCHHRIDSLKFSVPYPRLEELLEDPGKLEGFLLERITPHRR